jgi:hypothetical protein
MITLEIKVETELITVRINMTVFMFVLDYFDCSVREHITVSAKPQDAKQL